MKNRQKQAIIIKLLTELDYHSDSEIADFFGISREMVNKIRHGDRYTQYKNLDFNYFKEINTLSINIKLN